MPSCIIIKNDGIGDLILSSGLISDICLFFHNQVDLVTCETNREIAESIEGLRKIYYISRDSLRFFSKPLKIGICLQHIIESDKQVMYEIKANKYEYALCLRKYIRASSFILMQHINAKNKVYMWKYPTNVSEKIALKYTKKNIHLTNDDNNMNELTYYQSLLSSFFNTTFNSLPHLLMNPPKLYKQQKKSIAIGMPGDSSANWPLEYYFYLIKSLCNKGWNIYILGGKCNSVFTELIENNCSCINLVGKLTFKETLPYLMKSQYYIGNDTGLSHFASIYHPKCLIIYGGGTFKHFFPWPKSSNQFIIYKKMNCFNCNWKCKYATPKCLNKITPDIILDYLNKIVSKTAEQFYNISET